MDAFLHKVCNLLPQNGNKIHIKMAKFYALRRQPSKGLSDVKNQKEIRSVSKCSFPGMVFAE
jgi:hypothetical protein